MKHMRALPILSAALLLLAGSACAKDASATVQLPARTGVAKVVINIKEKGDQLCLRGDEIGGWCGDGPTEASPVVFGTSSSGGPDSPLYVIGAALGEVESFSVVAGSQRQSVAPTPVGDSNFEGMDVWLVAVESPAGISTNVQIQDVRRDKE